MNDDSGTIPAESGHPVERFSCTAPRDASLHELQVSYTAPRDASLHQFQCGLLHGAAGRVPASLWKPAWVELVQPSCGPV